MNPYIVVVGSINNDLIISTDKLPRMGETVNGSGFMIAAGGKGANQAVAAARLGVHVHMVGAVGDDIFGERLKANLRENGVEENHVATIKDCPTGTAVIVLYNGNNSIIIDAGANERVTREAVTNAEELIKDATLLMVQLEIPLDTVMCALKTAHRHNVPTLLNPAPAHTLSDDVLRLVDIIIPNETECEMITGIKADTLEGAANAVTYLRKKGIRQAVVTLGENGAVFNDIDEIFHMPARNVDNVVDTTAAGDSFLAGFAVALTEGRSIAEAVAFANIAGSVAVTRKGAQPSLPFRHEVECNPMNNIYPVSN